MSSRSSRTDGPRALPEHVVVGQIRKAHGLQGEVVVDVLSDVPGRFVPNAALRLTSPAGLATSHRLLSVRGYAGHAIMHFEGVSSREEAESLRGWHVEVARAEVPQAEPGSYYQFELIGCTCTDVAEGPLGEVIGLVEDGGGILLEIRGSTSGDVVLVPFVAAFLESVNVDAGMILLRLPRGLLETCTSRS